MPARSRRSMKTQPPWSRRTETQPNRMTCFPPSAARRAPQSWVRFRSLDNSRMAGSLARPRGPSVGAAAVSLAVGGVTPSVRLVRLRILYHGNCFDGATSAGLFTRFYRERIRADVELAYLPMEHKGA